MWLDIVFWLVLFIAVIWIIIKSGILLRLAEGTSKDIYARLSEEEKAKFDEIAKQESNKNPSGSKPY